MLDLLKTRWRQGVRTVRFPSDHLDLPPSFRGRPVLDPDRCEDGCRACVEACPTGAVTSAPLRLDLGACLFCAECVDACPTGAIAFSSDHRLAARDRSALVVGAEEEALASEL